MPKISCGRAKRTLDGRFVSKAEAERLFALEQVVQEDDASSDINNSAHANNARRSMVVITDPRLKVPRRERTGMNERDRKKFRSIELALEGERARTSVLVERIAEQRLQMDTLQQVSETGRHKAIKSLRELCRKRSVELERVRDCLRKAKVVNARARVEAAAVAAQAARRILVELRASNAVRVVNKRPPLSRIRKCLPPADENNGRARYHFVRNRALKLQSFLSEMFLDGYA